ncbi:hypothetical protein PENTCL1PPCAC_14184, partial [Pristionchus entomophagus]
TDNQHDRSDHLHFSFGFWPQDIPPSRLVSVPVLRLRYNSRCGSSCFHALSSPGGRGVWRAGGLVPALRGIL